MSRIGRKPVVVPQGVNVKVDKGRVYVSGPKGKLDTHLEESLSVKVADGKVLVESCDSTRKAVHGTIRSVIQNLVLGVTEGFNKVLEIQGVGFRAKVDGKNLELQLGFSHPVRFAIPEGITINVEKNVVVHVSGPNKYDVGEVCAKIRRYFPAEPYKGKGIRYRGEHVRRKAGKTVA